MARPKKPTNLKVLEGNPGQRPIPENEPSPQPVCDIPKPPPWMNTDGKKMWKHVAPQLERLGLLTEVDLQALAAACQSWGLYVECERFFRKKNPETGEKYGRTYIYTNKEGHKNEIERPQVKIGQKALEHFRSFMAEFGLTPSSRAKINIKPPESEEDPMEALINGGDR